MTNETSGMALVEQVAAILHPEAWRDDLPVPTRDAVESFHFGRQVSADRARAIVKLCMEHAAGVADVHAAKAWDIGEAEGQNVAVSSGRNHAGRAIASAIRQLGEG